MGTLKVKRVPIQRYQEVRKFNGLPFKFIERNLNKTDAVRTRDLLKYKGNLVRIIKTKLGFEVWAYPKKHQAKKC